MGFKKKILIIVLLCVIFPLTACLAEDTQEKAPDSQNTKKRSSNMSIIDYLKETGNDAEAEMLENKERNSIRIKTEKGTEDDFSLGESKIGGMPHLPSGFEWPYFKNEPLVFIAQFNLSEVKEYDTENKLPDTGIMYFFYEGGIEVWGDEPTDKDGFKVIYYDGALDSLEKIKNPTRVDTREYDDIIIKPCKLSFAAEKSYPLDQMIESDEIDYEVIDDEYYEENEEQVINKMFGYPDLVQGDVFYTAAEVYFKKNKITYPSKKEYKTAFKKELNEWQLLFQIDSDDNADVMWGDVGRVYFMIRNSDLESQNFDDCWIEFQCS